jgi:hypothetical protein
MSYLLMTEEQALELNGYQVGVNVFNAAKLKDSELYAVHTNAKNDFPELDLSEFEEVEEVEFHTEDEIDGNGN